ncbi:MAG TPA: flippase, partial [Nitrospirota bacterium]|nr:flippase [Nitrospirota bacterium]
DLVRHPERREVILGTAFTLKLMGGFLCLFMTLTSIAIMRSGDSLSFWLVGLSAAGFIFQSLNVINLYFRFRVESKYAVYGSGAAFIIVSLVKIALLMGHAPLIAFGWAGLAEVVLASFFLLIVYRRHHNDVRAWKFKKDIALELLRDSYPLILSNLAIMLYMRIDQVMLGQMRGDAEVGIFSAAVRISEVWYFIPGIIYSSVFSTIIAIRRHDEILYYQKLQKLFDVMALIGLSVAIVSIYISPYAVRILFGVNYAASSDVLSIHIWTGVFYCLGVASGCWFIAENLQKYVFYRTAYGAIINIMLNLYMIPAYGSKGAAISTIISQAFASVFFNSFNAETRPLFIRQIRALSPYRIFLKC